MCIYIKDFRFAFKEDNRDWGTQKVSIDISRRLRFEFSVAVSKY